MNFVDRKTRTRHQATYDGTLNQKRITMEEASSIATPARKLARSAASTTRGASSAEASAPKYGVADLEEDLANIAELEVRNGSPVLLEPCSQDTMDDLVKQLRRLRKSVPRMFVERGTLYLEEADDHESIVAAFNAQVVTYNMSIGIHHTLPLEMLGSSQCMLAHGKVQPDSKYVVCTVPPRGCPNLVVEVAMSQTFRALHHKANRYFDESPNVLVAIAVKAYSRNQVLLALVYERSSGSSAPTTAVSFGARPMPAELAHEVMATTGAAQVTGYVEGHNPLIPCDRYGIQQYLLRIDHRLALAINDTGRQVAPEHENAPELVFDLFEIQESLPATGV